MSTPKPLAKNFLLIGKRTKKPEKTGFVKRQQVLALRLPEATSLARSLAFDKPNVEIFYGFVKRQQVLALRLPEATSLARSLAFDKPNVEIFFNNLQVALERHAYQPHSVWNLETGITTVQKSPRIVADKGAKQIGQVTSHERGVLVTMCCCANAVGQALPPAYIFPRVHFQPHVA